MKSSRCATPPERLLIVQVPELDALLREATRVPPLLRSLVARAPDRRLRSTAPAAELALGEPIAAAALTRRIDFPDDHRGCWLRADPIELVPDLAAVWLRRGRAFSSGAWVEELREHFSAEGLAFELAESGRGYLRLPAEPDCRFYAPWQLDGESLERVLPDGPDRQRWRRLLTESQILLQDARRRAEQPEEIPGSLWFWGAGQLPERSGVEPRVDRLRGDNPELLALADWLGLEQGADRLDGLAGAEGLLVWPGEPAESADANLNKLQDLLRPAWRGLRTGRIRALELADRNSVRRFRPRDAWRVWR